MTTDAQERIASEVYRGALAGLAGTVVMTGFQKVVEMPLTGRSESYAPADLVARLTSIRPRRRRDRRALNYAAHFGIGAAWGAAHAIAERAGLRGQRAVGTVFGALYTGDVIANTALGLYRPWRWSLQDTLVDVGNKLVLAEATGMIYERLAARDGSQR